MTIPVISGVSGAISTGQVLTVAGTDLIAEVRTNYDAFFTAQRSGFEGSDPVSDGYDTNRSAPELQYDSTVKLKGSKSIRMLMTGVHLWPSGDGVPWGWPVVTANSPWSAGQPKDVYIRGYSRWNYFDSGTGALSWPRNVPASGNPTPSKKQWWANNTGITGWSLQFDCNDDGSAPSAWHVELTTRITGVDESTALGSFPDGALKNNRWYCFEYHYVKAGSGGPYVVEGWVDGVLTASVPAVAGFDPSNTGTITSKVNEWNTNATWQGYEWCDELAVSTSRIRPLSIIEIGDSATYASAHPKYQAPEFLSDVSNQITCDLTGLTGPVYWMWVTDNAGNRSAAFPLGVGGGEIQTLMGQAML